MYALKIGASNFINQILPDIKGQISSDIVIMGDFNNPLSSMDRSYRQKKSTKKPWSNTVSSGK
jgi:hypothetical protein